MELVDKILQMRPKHPEAIALYHFIDDYRLYRYWCGDDELLEAGDSYDELREAVNDEGEYVGDFTVRAYVKSFHTFLSLRRGMIMTR